MVKGAARMPNNVCPESFPSQYHDLIGLIYDAIDHPNGFFPFIDRFIQVFDGLSACFAIYDLKAGNLSGVWSANMPEEALAFYAEHVATQDLLLKSAMTVNQNGRFNSLQAT